MKSLFRHSNYDIKFIFSQSIKMTRKSIKFNKKSIKKLKSQNSDFYKKQKTI